MRKIVLEIFVCMAIAVIAGALLSLYPQNVVKGGDEQISLNDAAMPLSGVAALVFYIQHKKD